MATTPTIMDSDFKYIDKKGNLLRTRTELTIAQMLTFLEEGYEYDFKISLKNGKTVKIDFKTKKGLIEVIDNGPGIIGEALDKVFVPFFSTKKTGSGIGLSLSRQIMQLHNGNLYVTSIPGVKTVFTLRF